MMKKNNNTLEAFTSLALALPAIGSASDLEQPQIDYQFSFYDEQDDRMTVRAHQVRASLPFKGLNVQLDLIKDIVSGASPNFNLPDSTNSSKAIQVLSGASIKEERDVVNLNVNKAFEQFDITLGAGHSSENDYKSNSFSSELGYDFNQKNSRLNFGWGLSLDDISRTGALLDESKRSVNYVLGFSQLLSPKASINVDLSYSQHRGYLSDPYKNVFIKKQGIQADIRPESRYQWAFQVGYKQYINEHVALNLAYRYYQDSWDIQSHTLTLSAPLKLSSHWVLRPSLRYYSQNEASFYKSYFQKDASRKYQSSDYRLAGFGSFSPELKLENQFNDQVSFNAGIRYYKASHHYKLGGSADFLPSALSFYLFNIGISVQF